MNKKKSNCTYSLIKYVAFIIVQGKKVVIPVQVMTKGMLLKEIDIQNICIKKSVLNSRKKEKKHNKNKKMLKNLVRRKSSDDKNCSTLF